MLIFDGFASVEKAKEFALATTEKYKLDTSVHETQESSDAVDIFPFALEPMIVLVERPDIGDFEREIELEREITESVGAFAGRFAGT